MWMAGKRGRAGEAQIQRLTFRLASGFLFAALSFARAFLRTFFRRDFLSLSARFGETDRDRLLPALDLLAGSAALQSPGLALSHRAPNFGRCFLRVLSCHDTSPG